ncbi:MBL fold metallo-hydrolase [Raoultibacter massiliensis]|uniref:MBL fold metallo-hydrolase n=1 Tax=Raoultibacter massiliensis TaxID=1852371 RepID=A0ABV1JDP9_9ACTN|nr:MBL fold metallo-hydrolase [Raoultibacter massiliensis]
MGNASRIGGVCFEECSEIESAKGDCAARLSIHVLASGSGGNASVIVDGATGKAIVIDCGICKRDFFSRCEEAGVSLANIEGILITHEHTDHTKGLGVALRGMAKLGLEPAVFVSEGVHAKSSEIRALDAMADIRPYTDADALSLGGMLVHPFATSHDSVESYGFRIEGPAGDALGFMTDTGIVTDAAFAHLKRCRILAIESNHDEKLLAEGPYPYVVKRRIASDAGHLSNVQSADVLEGLLCDELEHVIAMHVSENNNTYRLPEDALSEVVARNAHAARVQVAYQHMRVSAE